MFERHFPKKSLGDILDIEPFCDCDRICHKCGRKKDKRNRNDWDQEDNVRKVTIKESQKPKKK